MWLLSVNILCLIILSSAVTTGTEDLNPFGGRRDLLCLLLSLFSVFLQQNRFGLRGFVCGDKRLGPTLHRLFMSLRLLANTHTNVSYTTQTHPLTSAYFSNPKGTFPSPSIYPSLPPTPPEGSSVNKGIQACFCFGWCPQAIPHRGFIHHKRKTSVSPPFCLSLRHKHTQTFPAGV